MAMYGFNSAAESGYPCRMSRKSKRSKKAERLGWFAAEWRSAMGSNQELLAEKLRTKAPQISNYETLGRQPNVEKIVKIAHALGIEPWQLFTDPAQTAILATGWEAQLLLRLRDASPEDRATIEKVADRFLKPDQRSGNA